MNPCGPSSVYTYPTCAISSRYTSQVTWWGSFGNHTPHESGAVPSRSCDRSAMSLSAFRWRRGTTRSSESVTGERVPLLGGREVEAGVAGVAGPRPTGRNHLGSGVEADTFGTVNVLVTEERVLPPPEGVERHRDRDGHVDADHPDVHPTLEAPGGLATGGEDRCAVAVGVAVDQRDGFVDIVDPDHGEHGTEDLLLVDIHVRGDVVDDGGA